MAQNGQEEFALARGLIQHEDGLINNRVTWLLVLQGFLFNAVIGGVGLLEKYQTNRRAAVCLEVGVLLLTMVGVMASLAARNVIGIAFRQATEVHRWWHGTGFSKDFPPLSGRIPTTWSYRLFSTAVMPWVLIAVWVLVAALIVVGFY